MQDKIQELLDKICGFKYTQEWKKLNFNFVPVSAINAVVGSEEDFNNLYQLLLKSNYETIKRTKSGGISISKDRRLYHHYTWDIKQYKSVIEITVCKPVDYKMRTYRIQYRNNNYVDETGKESLIPGYICLNWFKSELRKDGIELDDYAVDKETGCKLNSEIHAPDVRLFSESYATKTRTFTACHLDFHKFYMSGLLLSHPEMAYTIQRLADKGKTNKKIKTMLATIIGKFHSEGINYKYASLAKDAINAAYKQYDEVLEKLAKDRKILLTNTDGIWYEGEEWHGVYEGPNLGQWSTDHKNVKLRIKTRGSYEYLEDNKYYPVVRGRTKLDNLKTRDEWQWGDIFRIAATQEAYIFKKGVGIIWQKVN